MDLRPHRPPRTPLQRALIFVGVLAFAGFGILFFGGRVPADALLRFDLPPTLRAPGVSFPRAEVSRIDAELSDTSGARAASASISISQSLEGPRSPPAPVRLRPGSYGVRAKITHRSGLLVVMSGIAKIDDGEVVVDLESTH